MVRITLFPVSQGFGGHVDELVYLTGVVTLAAWFILGGYVAGILIHDYLRKLRHRRIAKLMAQVAPGTEA